MGEKYTIGLTGNIATGKSIVRRMLQELGASTIDADSLVHMLQRPGTPVYKEIVETFGTFVLGKDAKIIRKRLADIAFSSPDALKALEAITHPAVRQQIIRAITKAPTHVVVIEAIKLLEGGLADSCDAIWVVDASEDTQMVRLMTKRHMSSQEALRRIRVQTSQQQKINRADVVIDNDGDLIKTWNFVQKQFNAIPKPEVVAEQPPATVVEVSEAEAASQSQGEIEIRRAKRGDLSEMAALITETTQGNLSLDEGEMMERLFSKGYLVAVQAEKVIGMVGWQTENLIAGIDDFFIKSDAMWSTLGEKMLDAVESAVSELSCEAGLVFLHKATGSVAKKVLENKGYIEKQSGELDKMWREAADDWAVDNTILMVKQLLERRIMTPI